jgi:hypothetical protein
MCKDTGRPHFLGIGRAMLYDLIRTMPEPRLFTETFENV